MIRVSFVAKLSLIVTVVYPSGGILNQKGEFTVKITVNYSTMFITYPNDYLTECRRRGELPAPETEHEPNSVHLFGPVDDFRVLCVHVFAEVEQNGMLPAGKSVAGWMA